MSKITRVLVAVFFMVPLGLGACGELPSEPMSSGEPMSSAQLASVDVPSSDESLEVGASCECGKFTDDDGDGVCDAATTGECRKARTGRCPCGGLCTSCL